MMAENLAWLRPHFERIMEEYWATTQMAYRLWPQVVTITYDDVGNALQKLLGARPEVTVERLDLAYQTYPRQVYEEISVDDKTNRAMARAEIMDCDDFAWGLKANLRYWYNASAVGFVVDKSSYHAYNIIVFTDGTASLFEPQQDRFVVLDEPIVIPGGVPLPGVSSGRYSLTKGLILI